MAKEEEAVEGDTSTSIDLGTRLVNEAEAGKVSK
jgi:hypothetical protein